MLKVNRPPLPSGEATTTSATAAMISSYFAITARANLPARAENHSAAARALLPRYPVFRAWEIMASLRVHALSTTAAPVTLWGVRAKVDITMLSPAAFCSLMPALLNDGVRLLGTRLECPPNGSIQATGMPFTQTVPRRPCPDSKPYARSAAWAEILVMARPPVAATEATPIIATVTLARTRYRIEPT